MPIMIDGKGGGGDFTPVSEGLHLAFCSQVILLGLQPGSDLYPKPKRQLRLGFLIVDENVTFTRDGKEVTAPAAIGTTFTASLAETSKLRPLLESWRGRKFSDAELEGFDVSKLLGVPAQVQVLHASKGGKVYANIASIVPWPKGMDKPAVHDLISYNPDENDPIAFAKLPKWLQEKIDSRIDKPRPMPTKDSETGFHAEEQSFDDDLPF